MLRLDFNQFDLPFEYPFAISKGLKTHQKSLVIFLGMGGQYGLGEATEIGYYADSSMDNMLEILKKNQQHIGRYAYNGPHRFWHYLHHLIPDQHFLISALDMASWDLWSRLQGKAVYAMLGYRWADIPATDYTLGICTKEELMEKMARHPYPVYKLKVDGEKDAVLLETVLKHSPAKIRIDANEGWNLDVVRSLQGILKNERIELVEQPFHREDLDSLAHFRANFSIPVLADEAITDMKSLKANLDFYDGVNIKLSKCGGLTPAVEMIDFIKKSKKKVMLGNMNESNIGAAALAQLLPASDYADIDGPLLLKENTGTGLRISVEGVIDFEAHLGIGVRWKPLD